MSKTVDERVVEMRFDNKQFESGVQTSLSTLDKLKKSLNLTGASKGLEDVSSAAKGVNMSGLSNAVETVQLKFSAMQIVAMTALANITNSAVNAGKRIVSALTIDPVKSGFSEYETQINAVQTILANTESKGKTLEDVNKALDELNTYADKTIYNFTEMTRNIGTFTAAGVDLDTSVAAIKGIANLAAVSGSTSQQASTAMYQLSQALASGTVKLMDWNSVVNAGMGGQVFQDALKETARVHGIEIDKMIESEGSFRDTLQKGWLTSEILTETLSKFTGDLNEEQLKTMGYTDEQIASIVKMGQTANDAATKVKTFTQLFDTLKEAAQSGWTQSWEIIVGDFEEAKVLLTEVSDTFGAIIGASAQSRNEMLQGWKDLGGRTAFIDAVRNAFQGVLSIIKPIKEAFREIFPPMTAERLFNLTEGLKNLTARLKLGESTANKLKRTFKGVFALIDIGVQIISAIARGFMDLVGFIAPAGDGLLGFTAKIGDVIVKFRDFLKSGNVFNKAVGAIVTTLGKAITGVMNFVSKIGNAIKSFASIDLGPIDKFTEHIEIRFQPLTALGNGIKKVCEVIIAIVKKLAPVALALGKIIGQVFGGLFNKISTAVKNADFNTLMDLINAGLLGGLLVKLKSFISSMDSIKETIDGFLGNIKGIVENVNGILSGVKDSVRAFQQDLKAKTLLKIAGAIAILTASILVLSTIDSDKLTASLGAMTTMFIELFGSMTIFQKIMGDKGSRGMGKMATGMIGLSLAVLILAAAMTKVAKLEWSEITKGLTAIAGLTAMMVAAAAILGKTSGKMTKGMSGLIMMALAMKILVGVVRDLGALDVDTLKRGLSSVAVLLAEVMAFMLLTNKTKVGIGKGTGLVLLATSLTILASAVKKFASLDGGALTKGLTAVGIILAELAIFTNLTKNSKRVVSTATGLTILAAAMLIFAKAIKNMGSMDWDTIGKGLLTMAGALAIVVGAMKLLPKGGVFKGTSLVLVATSLLILGRALSNMGGMSWGEVTTALVTLAGSLGIIAAAMALMRKALPGAAAMLVLSTALAIFTPMLKILGRMSLEEIGRGLLTLAGVFAVVGAAGYILAPVTPIILALSAAIALLGVGCLAAGVGILAISAGLAALAVSGTAGAAALVIIVSSLISLIPMILSQVGQGIIELCKVIANGSAAICDALAAVLIAVLGAINRAIPPLMEVLGTLLVALLDLLVSYTPKIIDAGMKIIISILKGIADNIDEVVKMAVEIITNFLNAIASQIPNIIAAGFNIILSFINGLADAITEYTPQIIEAVKNLFNAIKNAALLVLTESIPGFSAIGSAIMNNGFIQGIKSMISSAVGSVGSVVSKCVSKIGEFVSKFKNGAKNLISSFKDGIGEKVTDVVDTVKSIPAKCVEKLKEKISDFKNVGKDMMNGLIEGVKSKFQEIKDAATGVISGAVSAVKNFLGIHSPSRVFAEIGEYSDEGFAEGLTKFAGVASSAAKDVGNSTVDSLKSSLSKVSDVINDNFVADPTIRPVIDLTEIQNGAAAVDGLFSNPQLSLAKTGINVSSINANTGSLAHMMSQHQFNANDNKDVIASLDAVREDIQNLGVAFAKMKIVLDSGATVGGLESELDKAMGVRTTYKGRWM